MNEPDVAEIVARIIRVRRALGLSQMQLARRCGLSRGVIAHIEAKRVGAGMSVATLCRLAVGLNVRPSWLLDGTMPKDRRGRVARARVISWRS